MAWAGGVWDDTGTSTSNVAGGMITYYDRKFLMRALNTLVFAPLGQKRDLPKGEGKTIQFFRYNEIAVSPSGAYLTEGTNPDPTAITGQDISATLAEWGAFSQHSSLIKDTHIDRGLAGVAELWGDNAGSTMDLAAHMASASGGLYPIRADGTGIADDDFGLVGTTTSAGTSTQLISTQIDAINFGGTNDDLNQSIVVITSGTGYGQARPITDYVATGGICTVTPAWDVTPASGDSFHIVSAHAETSLLDTPAVRRAVTQLRNNKATPISGGNYVGVLSPDTEAGLMADATWVNVMTYKDRPEIKVNGLFNGEVGEWGGVRWVRETQPFRFPTTTVGTAGTAYGVGAFVPGSSYTNYSATGNIYSTPILGKEAFGVTTLAGAGDSLKPGIIIKNPGSGDTSNPLNRFSTVGWYLPFIAKGLNPMFGVQIWSAG